MQYEFDTPEAAYKEAQGRIKKAKKKSLTYLYLDGLGLNAVPPEIAQLPNLTNLYINKNRLTTIPSEIAKLNSLTKIDLSSNHLTFIPPDIAHLVNLKVLWLGDNQIIFVPTELAKLTNLTVLSLSSNWLTAVPSPIFELTNLKRLWLNNNRLTTISPEIVQLYSLNALYLSHNNLSTIPIELTRLPKLELLQLENNPDLLIPPEIMAQSGNAQAILNYLRERQESPPRPLNEAKLIFVGQGSVGKTSIIKRLLYDQYDPHEEPTKGISIEKWQLDVARPEQGTVSVALNVWDFGGQEIMHATHQFFLTKRSLYLLVLDARQGEEEGRVEYWLSLINSFAPDAPILIIINKIDQQRLDVDRRGLQKKYKAIHGFIPTSAREDIGISKLKTEIAKSLASIPYVDSLFPANWMRVKEALITMQKIHNFIPYTEYQQLCLDNGVDDTSSQETLISFLHDLGIALNFLDDDHMRETSVLNPNWVTRGVYTLLNSSILQERGGILHRSQLRDILPPDEYPPAQRRFLLDMMLKFELAFAMPDENSLLIPDLLTKEEPEFEWGDESALQFAYKYQILPHNILHRFMVRQYNLVDPDIRWRTGVLLHHDNLSALVRADIEAKTIRIAISGEGNRRQFLYSLRLTFASIHKSPTGTNPQEMVPIPGHPDAPPQLYSYLEELEKMHIAEQLPFPDKDGKVILLNVQELLNGVTTSAMRQSGLPSQKEILEALHNAFNENEFYELLFNLKIDRKDLEGDSVSAKMLECVLLMQRNGRLAELVVEIQSQRDFLFTEDEEPYLR